MTAFAALQKGIVMKITVIGCGRWGSLIAWYLSSRKGHDLTLYGRPSSLHMKRFLAEGRNDLLTLPETVRLSTSLADCITPACETVIISVGAQGLRALMAELSAYPLEGKTVVLFCLRLSYHIVGLVFI